MSKETVAAGAMLTIGALLLITMVGLLAVSPLATNETRASAKKLQQIRVVLNGNKLTPAAWNSHTTVASVLKGATWPQPIDFDSAAIHVERPSLNQGVVGDYRVDWDHRTQQPSQTTNHRLMPGDRVVVQTDATLPVDQAANTQNEDRSAASVADRVKFNTQEIEDR